MIKNDELSRVSLDAINMDDITKKEAERKVKKLTIRVTLSSYKWMKKKKISMQSLVDKVLKDLKEKVGE